MTGKFILVAEDDVDDRYLMETAFQEKGFSDRLEFVDNGVELLKYLESVENAQYPGFIMLDLNMPKKDGREVLKEIKQHPVFKKIPVIIFTTTKNDAEIKRCYELGANSYIVKPASFESLLHVIQEIRNYWLTVASIPS